MLMPLAIAAAPPKTSEIFDISCLRTRVAQLRPEAQFAASSGSLILRPSTSLPRRNVLVLVEGPNAGTLCELLELGFAESRAGAFNHTAGLDQEQRRHMRDLEGVADGIAGLLGIEQGGQRDAVLFLKFRRGPG